MQLTVRSPRPLRFRALFLLQGRTVRSLARGIWGSAVIGLGWDTDESECALRWCSGHEVEELLSLGAGTQASGIGEKGVVGSRNNEALLWGRGKSETVRLHPTALLGDAGSSCALAIDQQRIVGSGQGSRTEQRRQALVWLEPHPACAHRIHPEALLGSESFSHAQSLEGDWVVGYGRGTRTSGDDQALLWQTVGPTDVVSLHPSELLGADAISYATGVSQQRIVGYGRGSQTQRRVEALCWPSPDTESAFSLHPQGLLGEQASSWAVAISGSWIVGYGRSHKTNHVCHALVWQEANPASAINLHAAAPRGSVSSRAYAVSPTGVVVGCIDDKAAVWIPEYA